MNRLTINKIIFYQALILILFGALNYFFIISDYFQKYTNLYFIMWPIFIALYISYIRLLLLPSKNFYTSLYQDESHDDLDWDRISKQLDLKNKEIEYLSKKFSQYDHVYKGIIDSFLNIIFVIDKDLNIIYSNDAFKNRFGYTQQKKLIETVRNYKLQQFIADSILKNTPTNIPQFCFEQITASSLLYYTVSFNPLKEQSLFLIELQDITEKVSTDIIREEFVANFSHEVKTPLSVIDGQVQLLADAVSNGETGRVNEQVEKIIYNSKRLTKLFNDILSFTALDKSKTTKPEFFNFYPLLENVFADVKTQYPQKQAELVSALEIEDIYADYHQFEQVLYNIIENAFKYSKDTLVLNVSSHEINNNVVIDFKDNGIGIKSEHLLRIFERFYRVDHSHSSQIPGSGLGLSIVKKIIAKHAGKITVSSPENQGTTFTVILPKRN